MAWTAPKTDWITGELITAEDMNAVGENLATLKNPASAAYTTTADINADIREFADVDSDNLNLTITTAGGDVLVHFSGSVQFANHRWIDFDIEVDGNRLGGVDGILRRHFVHAEGRDIVTFSRLIQDLSAGSHTFKLQWKQNGSVRMLSHAQYWVREVS